MYFADLCDFACPVCIPSWCAWTRRYLIINSLKPGFITPVVRVLMRLWHIDSYTDPEHFFRRRGYSEAYFYNFFYVNFISWNFLRRWGCQFFRQLLLNIHLIMSQTFDIVFIIEGYIFYAIKITLPNCREQ